MTTLEIDSSALTTGLAAAAKAAQSRNGVQALNCVLLDVTGDTLSITGSDLELTVTVGLPVAGATPGRVAINPTLLTKALRSVSGTVKADAAGSTIKISAGRASFDLAGMDADSYPAVTREVGHAATVSADVLLDRLARVATAAGTDSNRPILTGVLFTAADGHVELTATDSYRLAMATVQVQPFSDQTVLVPRRAITELARTADPTADLQIGVGDRCVTFSQERDGSSFTVSSTLISGDYPNYKALIPDTFTGTMHTQAGSMAEAAAQAAVVVDSGDPLALTLEDGQPPVMTAKSHHGTVEAVFDGTYSGTPLTVGFSPVYLAQAIAACGDGDLTVSVQDHLRPVSIRPNDDFHCIVMPMRIT